VNTVDEKQAVHLPSRGKKMKKNAVGFLRVALEKIYFGFDSYELSNAASTSLARNRRDEFVIQ
jgi:outer membrane protein OmpA-like peptidoglycan-associated protein